MANELVVDTSTPAQSTNHPLPEGYADLLNDIKTEINSAVVRVQRSTNTEQIRLYWEIGKLIIERETEEGWGAKVVDRLAVDLRTAYPGQRGFSRRSLLYMLKMARAWPTAIVQQAAAQLPWGHIMYLLDKFQSRSELDFYAAKAVEHGWSRAVMSHHISTQLFGREGVAPTNFDATIPGRSDILQEIAKEPYRLEFTRLDEGHAEAELEMALVRNIVRFLQELGVGFAFVGHQYPLAVDDEEFRVDMLFYHLKLHRYVAIELKTRGARPEHIGKLSFYTAVIDDKVRDPARDEPTLGILIAASKGNEVVDYALKTSNQPIAVSTYRALPPEIRALLPSAEDLAQVAHDALENRS